MHSTPFYHVRQKPYHTSLLIITYNVLTKSQTEHVNECFAFLYKYLNSGQQNCDLFKTPN